MAFPAAQMWLLGRVLPYMIGEYIPQTDEHWQNYLRLLEIVDLLFSPSITEDDIGYLSVLITEHHQSFVTALQCTTAAQAPLHGTHATLDPKVS